MVPTHLVVLPALPRGDRGKIDRMALPPGAGAGFAPPRGAAERRSARLWSEVLRVQRVGREDGFYALGGDSLSVTQMLARVTEVHGVRLKPSDLGGRADGCGVRGEVGRRHDGGPIDPGLDDLWRCARYRRIPVGAPIFCFRVPAPRRCPSGRWPSDSARRPRYMRWNRRDWRRGRCRILTVRAAAPPPGAQHPPCPADGPLHPGRALVGRAYRLEAARLLQKQGETIELLAAARSSGCRRGPPSRRAGTCLIRG